MQRSNPLQLQWLLAHSKPIITLATASALIFGASACGDSGQEPTLPPSSPVQPTPASGATSFVSADAQAGEQSQDNRNSNNESFDAAAPDAGAEADDRTVEEGDIYRVMAGTTKILNLNAYRGLQIIDFANPAAPKIVGSVQVTGTPVEMYQVGDRVYILLNDWHHYYSSSRHALPESFVGGGVIVVDISDVTNPKITAKGQVDGWIQTSRLTRGNGKEALFVVASEYNGGGKTYVKSFSVSTQGKLTDKTKIELGGFVQDIQATPDRLIVARHDYQTNRSQSQISLIDISSPEGAMVEGDSILVKGIVRNKFNMDIHDDILRVVSGNSWGNNQNTNFVETFNASNFKTLTKIDSKTFGDNEQLFATLFMEEKAFFVTYERVDPFHAFEINALGQITEKSEFIVSGWNDYFKPVSSKTRLIGIGKNDTGPNGERINTMAVSLYDVTNLTNPNPLISRAEIELDYSWSEAQWDDRAFSVLEKATSVTAPDGITTETGLVLLPFSGWNETEQRYISAVQIYTFSDNTLTLRGVMEHGTPVRRSFLADKANNTTANLSEAELSLFDVTQPQTPTELGRVELAPNYGDFKIYGNYGVRHHDRSSYYGWWGGNNTQRDDSLQVVALAGDVDRAQPVAELQVPASAQTYKHNNLLVSVATQYKSSTNNQPLYESEVEVWDLSNPTQPAAKAALTTDKIQPYYGGYYGGCGRWGCDDVAVGSFYYYGGEQQNALSVGSAMVFSSAEQHQELEGQRFTRYIRPTQRRYDQGCYTYDMQGNYQPRACTYYNGGISCSKLVRVDGTAEAEHCSGQLYKCTQATDGENSCQEVEASTVPTTEDRYDYEQHRYWQSYKFNILDLSNPAQANISQTLAMPAEEEAAGVLAAGDKLYVTYRKPVRLPNDSRPYVRYYFKTIDLSNPALPVISAPVNIPGQLIAVDQDTLLTQDTLWGSQVVETAINKLKLQNNLAYLQGTYRFQDQLVQSVNLDRAGHAVVSHQLAWYANQAAYGQDYESYDYTNRMSVLNLNGATFSLLSTTDVDNWATLKDARQGRALFQVPGGLLVMNLDDATSPYAQAYFPTRGWPRDIKVEGQDIFFSAGSYGLYRFDLNANNLALP